MGRKEDEEELRRHVQTEIEKKGRNKNKINRKKRNRDNNGNRERIDDGGMGRKREGGMMGDKYRGDEEANAPLNTQWGDMPCWGENAHVTPSVVV